MNPRLRVVFWGLLAACVGWIASLPVFPSQDGPMHLYYAQILRGMLLHSTRYDGWFAVRTWVTVYSLYYYVLAGLMGWMSAAMAEKVVVCGVVVLFCVGFRALAQQLGPMGETVSLFVFPVILSWPLGMGFVSFTMCLGMATVALALWFGPVRRGAGWGYGGAYLLVLLVMMVTHPVPLLLVLGVSGAELLLRVRERRGLGRGEERGGLGLLAVGALTMGFVVRFTDARRMEPKAEWMRSPVGERTKLLVHLHSLALAGGTSAMSRAYHVALYAIALGGLAMGVQAWRRGSRDALLWVVGTVLLLVSFPWIPESMNGAAYFADRLVMLIWVGALLAAACGPAVKRGAEWWLMAGAAVSVALMLGTGERMLRPSAVRAERMEMETEPAAGALAGLGLKGTGAWKRKEVTFDPEFWEMARYFRREQAAMVNAPWLDLPILPLMNGGGLLTSEVSPKVTDDARRLLPMLPGVLAQRVAGHRPAVGFVMYAYGSDPGEEARFAAEMQTMAGGPWRCERGDLLMVCRAPGRRP